MWHCVIRWVVLKILNIQGSQDVTLHHQWVVLNILSTLASVMRFCVIRQLVLNILSTLASGMWCCVIRQLVLNILSSWGFQDSLLRYQATSSQHSEHSGLPGCDAMLSGNYFSTFWVVGASRMCCCVIRWVVPNILKTLHQIALTKWHSITSQKMCILKWI